MLMSLSGFNGCSCAVHDARCPGRVSTLLSIFVTLLVQPNVLINDEDLSFQTSR